VEGALAGGRDSRSGGSAADAKSYCSSSGK